MTWRDLRGSDYADTEAWKGKEICALEEPEMVKIKDHHFVKCHLHPKGEQWA